MGAIVGAIVGASTDASDRTYRLAFGPNAGRKALTLQTFPIRTEPRKGNDLVSKQSGFLCMPVSLVSLISARSSSACAAKSRDQPLQSDGAASGTIPG